MPNRNQFGTVRTEEMAVEVKHCVHAALKIAQMAAEIKDNNNFNQTYWVSYPPYQPCGVRWVTSLSCGQEHRLFHFLQHHCPSRIFNSL
jgi:hypothetical protein